MKLLALDSADGACSIAFWNEGDCELRHNTVIKDSLSWMAAQVAELRQELGEDWSELDGIACCVGPGGFTGVRVAVAYAQGLGMATGLPVLGVSSLDALALRLAQYSTAAECWVALDARMGELYAAHYRRHPKGPWARLGDERLLKPEALLIDAAAVVAGPGFEAWPERFGSQTVAGVRLDAAAVAQWASTRPVTDWPPAQALQPRYLRNEVAQTLAQRQART